MLLRISDLWRRLSEVVAGAFGPRDGDANEYRQALLWGYAVAAIFSIAFFGWAFFTVISGAVVAPGSIVIQGQVKTVQNLDGGIVAEIAVKEGQNVAKGDLLLRLDSSLLMANRAIVEGRLAEAIALQTRLLAERDSVEVLSKPALLPILVNASSIDQAIRTQTEILEARSLTREGQTNQLTERIHQFEEEIVGAQGLQIARREQLALISKELGGVKELYDQGHAPLTRVLALERESANLKGQISEMSGSIARLRSSIGETRLQLLQINKDFREQVLTELRDASAQVEELREQHLSLLEQVERTEIRSPVEGVVHELAMHTLGGVVRPAEPILKIVPAEKHLIINVRVEPLHIDQIYAGQSAFVKLTAFNSRSVPDLECNVTTVSPDLVTDERSGMAWYEANLELAPNEAEKLGGLSLVSGMPAEAFIRTTDRTVMGYLLKPLSDQIFRAFREE
ncbi:HlyD family type I secretion periplasmic adaptor subunit [Parvibaculaceae bacterium PLY_AMNH_Bact1]|nr:HlyD family type I secretion periplasmic adaptor subunit [Parvibaculaceae bacterium PLY_AMNH_Bact1]